MSETPREAVLTGGCQCGVVRYALYAPPEGTHICHCRMCQKAVGGPFAALAPVRLKDFAWTREQPGVFHSSSISVREFCPRCGTPLTCRYIDDEWTDVTIGSLDRPNDAPPDHQSGIQGRVTWLVDIVKAPEETTESSMPPELQAKMVNYQHPDHDTPADWTPPRGSTGG